MVEQMKLVPKRRFNGFVDEWEQRKFSDIVSRVSKQSNDFNYPRVEFEDIISGEGRLNKDITKKVDNRKGIFFEPNFILFGKLRPYLKNWLFPNFKGIAIGDFWVFESKDSSPIFNYYLIQSDRYQWVANLSTGTKMPRSDWNTVSETIFRVPSIEEQTKIGIFFKQLDENIALQQRKLEKTKSLKSAYLNEMFPADAEKVPKRRFAGFTNEWEESELGDIGFSFSGLSGKTKEDFGHGAAEFVTYMNVFSNAISDIKMTEKVVMDPKQNELKYGDVLFTTSSETPHEVGMSSVWLGRRPNVYLNSFCFGFRPTIHIDYLFLAYLLRSNIVRKQMELLAQGISRYNISKGKVMKINVLLPNIEEQEKIGHFFKLIDNRIANHERKLDKLKAIRQAYLHEMFM